MNTRITYRYTDKTNCKQYASIIVEGVITWEQIAPYLVKQHDFIPSQIGLEDLQYRFLIPGLDHPWHQILPEDIVPSEEVPTGLLSASNLARRFATTTWQPDQPKAHQVSPMMKLYSKTHTLTKRSSRRT